MKTRCSKLTKCLLASIAVLAMLLMLFGCSGSDGTAGAPGATGATGTNMGTLTGTVTAPNATTPLAGVAVTNNLTADRTTTDASGKFSLSLPLGTYTLSFAMTGYTTATAVVTIPAAGVTSAVTAVALAESATGLPSVVLASDKNEVGYGNTVNLTATVTPGANGSTFTYAWAITPPAAGSAQGLGKITQDATDPKKAVVTMPVMNDATTFRGAFDGTVKTIAGQIYQTGPEDYVATVDLKGVAAPAGTIVPADLNFVAKFVPQTFTGNPRVLPITSDTRGAVSPSLIVTDSLGGKVTVGMPATQPLYAAGLQPGVSAVALGEPVYLSSGHATPWAWTLTGPTGSTAALSSATAQYPFFIPVVKGKYTVKEGARTTLIYAGTFTGAIENGSYTTKTFNLNNPEDAEKSGMWYDTTVTAYWPAGATSATYTKWPTVTPAAACTACHANNVVVYGLTAPNMFTPWKDTAHANFFARGLEGITGNSGTCLTCHTVGYDLSVGAVNGGYDDVAKTNGFIYPATRVAGNWATMWASAGSASVAKMSNIQCENCHGPQETTDVAGSSAHISGVIGATQIDGTVVAGGTRVNFSSEVCAVCHASGTGHHFYSEWLTEIGEDPRDLRQDKGHANASLAQSHPSCGCHTAQAFAQWVPSLQSGNAEYDMTQLSTTGTLAVPTIPWSAADAQPQTCSACHDPHDATNPNQLRVYDSVKILNSGFGVTGLGKGAVCVVCHTGGRSYAQQCNGTVVATELLTGANPTGPAPKGTNPVTTALPAQVLNACIVAATGDKPRSQTLTFLHEDGDAYQQANPTYGSPHGLTEADVLMGRNVFFMGTGSLPMISKHAAVKDSCVGCHMKLNPQTHLSHGAVAVSSHNFAISEANADKLCANCHGANVSAESIQANVKALMAALVTEEGKYVQARLRAGVVAGGASTPYWRYATWTTSANQSGAGRPNTWAGGGIMPAAGTAGNPYVYVAFTDPLLTATPNASGSSFTIKTAAGVVQGVITSTQTVSTATFNSTSVFARGAAVTFYFTNPTATIGNKLYKANLNYTTINSDASFGIHNPSFVIQVLNNTIAAMKDTSN